MIRLPNKPWLPLEEVIPGLWAVKDAYEPTDFFATSGVYDRLPSAIPPEAGTPPAPVLS